MHQPNNAVLCYFPAPNAVPGVTIYFSDFKRSLVDKLQKVRLLSGTTFDTFDYYMHRRGNTNQAAKSVFMAGTVALGHCMSPTLLGAFRSGI